MAKKVVILTIALLLTPSVVHYFDVNVFSSVSRYVHTIGVCLTFFDVNDCYDVDLLRALFVETVYENYVESELVSHKSLARILSMMFVNFWLMARKIAEKIVSVVYACLPELRRKLGLPRFNICVIVYLPFVLLSYLKTHLKSYRFAPMVLRC